MTEEKKIFMSQQVLDALFEQGKAQIEGDILTIETATKQVYRMIPAVKFLSLAGGDTDPHNLLNKIFTQEQLKKSNADVYMDSVIYKDTAYTIETGFLGITVLQEAPKAAAAPEPAPVRVVVQETAAEAVKINASDTPTEAEDFKIKDLEDYLLKIF